MDELMRDHGGFEHNRQTLRILEVLEERYPEFPGLNLTWEVREGIIKHQPESDADAPAEYAPGEAPTLEAQLVDFVDEIAYNNHDVDDGLTSGMFTRRADPRGARSSARPTTRCWPRACRTSGSCATRWCGASSTAARRTCWRRRSRNLREARRRLRGGRAPGRAAGSWPTRRRWRPRSGAEGLPLQEHVPPLPRGADGGQGGPHPARPVPVLRRASRCSSRRTTRSASSRTACTAWSATTSRA